jgi:hypothetical protein
MKQLPVMYKTVINMRYKNLYSWQQIADLTGLGLSQVEILRGKIYRAMQLRHINGALGSYIDFIVYGYKSYNFQLNVRAGIKRLRDSGKAVGRMTIEY